MADAKKYEAISIAVELIAAIEKTNELQKIANAAREAIYPESDLGSAIPNAVEIAALKLADDVLGSELGSYYLYECLGMKDGGQIHFKGKSWRIKNIDDLRNCAVDLLDLNAL